MTEDYHSDSQSRDLADMALRMQYLLAMVRKADDRAYSIDEIARGTGVSLTYLRNMLAGRQDNPSRKVIAALADFFEVSPAYFFDTNGGDAAADGEPASEIEVALRSAARLGPEGRRLLLDMIRLAERITRQHPPSE